MELSKDIVSGMFIECQLVHLSCLGNMVNQPVWAFHAKIENGTTWASSDARYDVLASIDDLFDTWGPGFFVHSKTDPDSIFAIGIGGGYICQCNDLDPKFHWTQNPPAADAPSINFPVETRMLIGAAATVNLSCHIDEQQFRKNSCAFLHQLGTHEAFWSIAERQVGIQAGQYASMMYNHTYRLTPAKALKGRYFRPGGWLHLSSDLNHTWGLQVSLCTGVARRVRLRDLLVDLLPQFVDPTKREMWRKLKARNVLASFQTADLGDWLETLEPELQDYLLALVRSILEHLRDTGIDHNDKHLVIAWPVQDDLQRCLRIPCERQTQWAQILADSMECATFACVTAKCLVTDKVKCKANTSWKNASSLLATSFSCPGVLKDEERYFIKRFDTLLVVQVIKPDLGGLPHLVVRSSKIPSNFGRLKKRIMQKEDEKRKRIIRERQSHMDRGEDAIVRTLQVS